MEGGGGRGGWRREGGRGTVEKGGWEEGGWEEGGWEEWKEGRGKCRMGWEEQLKFPLKNSKVIH